MKYNLDVGFKEGDVVYHMKNINKKFKVHKIDKVEEGGSFHDGYEEKHYAYLEDLETRLIERQQVAFFNLMCQIKNIYFVKCEDQEQEQVK
jgi:hypothetical protein